MTFQKEDKFGHIAETSTLPSCLAFKSKLGQSLSTLHLNTRANKRILGKHKQGDEFLIHTGSRIKSHFHPHRHTTKGLAKGNINFFSWITKLSPDYSITCVCYPSLFKSPHFLIVAALYPPLRLSPQLSHRFVLLPPPWLLEPPQRTLEQTLPKEKRIW